MTSGGGIARFNARAHSAKSSNGDEAVSDHVGIFKYSQR